jgi:hypothetical protein
VKPQRSQRAPRNQAGRSQYSPFETNWREAPDLATGRQSPERVCRAIQ